VVIVKNRRRRINFAEVASDFNFRRRTKEWQKKAVGKKINSIIGVEKN
jgi:hypothetical protein